MKHARLLFALSCVLAGAACGGSGSNVVIEEQRKASVPAREVKPNATADERFFGPAKKANDTGMSGGASPDGASSDAVSYDLPSGWKTLAVQKDKGHLVDVQPAGNPQAECYLSSLAGVAGGIEGNVNRWRTQFGVEPLNGEAIAALPKMPLLGDQSTLVEIEGTYKGMGDKPPQPDSALVGLVISKESGSKFLKFTGPAAVVKAERERFLSFAGSLKLAEDHTHADDATPSGAPDFAPQSADGAALSWTAPAGWHKTAPRPMRDVNFEVGDGGECYISRLGSNGGGLRSNLDRWAGQLGNAPLSETELKALTQVRLLGQSTPLFQSSGTFTGMDGKQRTGQTMLGVACIREHDSVFVKFLGPSALVEAERAHFLAFVASLEEKQ